MKEEQAQEAEFVYDNDIFSLKMFVEQSENSEILLGKIRLAAKQGTSPPKLLIQLKGIYRIWTVEKKPDHSSTESNIDLSDTINELDNVISRRIKSHELQDHLEREECFLEGAQQISQKDERIRLDPGDEMVYPFIFNVPTNAPPSCECLSFANKLIQIAYSITIQAINTIKQITLKKQFNLQIRSSTSQKPGETKSCKILKLQCFTPFFCQCLGMYHIEVHSNLLHAGQLQIEGRVFKEGKKTDKLISCLDIRLMGELKDAKKMVIASKKMPMLENEYEMMEGEVLLSYDPNLHTFQSSLLTTRFWIECEPEFTVKLWKFEKQSSSSYIFL